MHEYRCRECGSDSLILISDCKWDEDKYDWVICWKQTSEGHCERCGVTVEIVIEDPDTGRIIRQEENIGVYPDF